MIKTAGMVALKGGTFQMGSNHHYPEEAPAHMAEVRPFAIDEATVTNAEFRRFVLDTGYVSDAERAIPQCEAPDLPPEAREPGGLVFTMTDRPVPLGDFRQWWRFVPGACWYQPEGPGSDLLGRLDHPVVQVSLNDAMAYAAWAGKALPTEKEWEFAARDGVSTEYPWGDQLMPNGRRMANIWHGEFPHKNRKKCRFLSCASRQGQRSRFGLYNMIGNVWEWTLTPYRNGHSRAQSGACCAPSRTVLPGQSYVTKGGSFLCAPSYCRRYRATARSPQEVRSTTNHLGFRCVLRPT